MIVATKFLTKWMEANLVETNDARAAYVFLFENVITRVKCLRILFGHRGTHFHNEVTRDMIDRF